MTANYARGTIHVHFPWTVATLTRASLELAAMLLLAALPAATVAVADPVVVYAAGDVADCRGKPAASSAAARTAKLIPPGATVLVLGDTTYPLATLPELESCYEPTWGAFRATTHVVPGNHDYVGDSAADFRAYFGAGASADGYFARRVGSWLLIGLDSQQAGASLERQYQWLEATLDEAAGVRCTLAFWHMPVFSSGLRHGDTLGMRRFWALLERYRAEFVLNGHEHFYEAFDPLDPDGRAAADGMREFVVGTGGARLYRLWSPVHASRARFARHGVLRLELGEATYAWQFIDTGGRVLDAGQAKCRE
jgi:3',5'-cyclic AMP phosphodiesterase CpdA